MKIRTGLLFIIPGLALGYLIMAMKWFYPYHRTVILALAAVLFVLLLCVMRTQWRQLKTMNKTVARRLLLLIPYYLILKVLLYLVYATLVLVPIEETPLLNLSGDSLKRQIGHDLILADGISDQIDTLCSRFEKDTTTYRSVLIIPEQRAATVSAWADYLALLLDLDLIKDRYKGFYQIDYNIKPDQHADAFFVAFYAFALQYYSIQRVTRILNRDPAVTAILDEPSELLQQGSYFLVRQWITHPDAILRLNAGVAYLSMVKKDFTLPEIQMRKLEDTVASIYQNLGRQPEVFVDNPMAFFERGVSTTWMPVQKMFSRQINILGSSLHSGSITPDRLRTLSGMLKSGDILLTRRNWEVVHIDLQGFWRHAAIVTDTSGEIMLIQADFEGVRQLPLSQMRPPDFLAVLRPLVSEEDRYRAIQWAMTQTGKPYDDAMDMATDALMSSELVAKAYGHVPGLCPAPGLTQGRYLVTPNDFAVDFDFRADKQDPEMEFVCYWDGQKSRYDAGEKGMNLFRKSWTRPKWTLLQE
ncbi:hypothetical protein JW948_14270 [bacterium]|nr:hypothetical protein [bacterium]